MNAGTEAEKKALNEVSDALRTLAAGIIRVMRGSSHRRGEPLMIALQAHSFVAALENYRGAAGSLPPGGDIARILHVDLDPDGPPAATDEGQAEATAASALIRASLQLIEGRLLAQEERARAAGAALYGTLSGLERAKETIARRREHEKAREFIRKTMERKRPRKT